MLQSCRGCSPEAREYLAWLAEATSRPLRFHPKYPATLLAEEAV